MEPGITLTANTGLKAGGYETVFLYTWLMF